MANNKIPLLVPKLPSVESLLPYFYQIDKNRWYTNFGPLVQGLEARFAEFFFNGSKANVVTATNGTAALEAALTALKLKPGAKVLVPALTFVATATAVLRCGYRPLIADVNPDSWLLTPEIAQTVLLRESYDAVMPVATFGAAQPVDEWDQFTIETGAPVIIDAAGAFGNQSIGKTTAAVFSLHATKALAAGEGGIVVTANTELAEDIRRLTNFGIDIPNASLVSQVGSNWKMSEYHAAVAHAALDDWKNIVTKRRLLQQIYADALSSLCPQIRLQRRAPDEVFPILVLLLPVGMSAVAVKQILTNNGIESRQWYCPTIDKHPAFETYRHGELSIACDLSTRLIGIPYFIDMAHDQILQVCRVIGSACDRLS